MRPHITASLAVLGLLLAGASARAAPIELITNGNFETGSLYGWTVMDAGEGGIQVDTPGTTTWESGSTTLGSPANGSWYAVSDQGGPGTHALFQSFTVPVVTGPVTLSFDMFVNDQDSGPFIDPVGLDHTGPANQHARVDILSAGAAPFDTGAGVLGSFYLGVDPKPNPNPFTSYQFDVTNLVGGGGTFQVRFAEVDNQFFFNQGVDNVSITAPGIAPQMQTVQVGGSKGWASTYDIEFSNGAVVINLAIKLIGDPVTMELRNKWEEGIETIWSSAFGITDGTNTYPIQVNVDWVTSGQDYKVNVIDKLGRPSMLVWYTQTDWGDDAHGRIAAHEVGHMLGLFDEYTDGKLEDPTAIPPFQVTTHNLMAEDLEEPQPRHFERILQWLEGQVNVDLSLAQSPLPPYPFDLPIVGFSDRSPTTPIPEPGAWCLALVGLSLLGIRVRLRRGARVS